ncbi:MAG: SDR family oxidoreductase [Oscillospiraceae bacterium]|nr:SDR family oxidoreductase [Oscillospiraceae bacterium]MBQ2156953.1 SDR family oxidoreductase [Oscillospiraceae bacterium]MBQ2231624.1 SDR family oxidoreductase [Oscillospiraceae bacterium]MBQ3951508.1 SDR family oxidoreductase [Oscillospiraceae bacterium]MBQ5503635.1 SDR family oxidoreductase [Oscillospiraceae bacterium]
MKNYFDLKDQVAIVTGCSTGLGVQMAKALANQGANIVVVARRKNLIEAVAADIAAEFGVKTLPVVCDITDTEAVEAMTDAALAEFGRIDILINNAGTGAVAPAEDITDEQFSHEMEIDLFGSFKVARSVAKKAMIPAKYGRIINIASMYGLVGNKIAGSSPYHAAKGGVVNLTRALAAEWGKYGITVNSICPGYFYTPLTRETLDSDFFQQNARTMIPEERYGNEGELDSAAIFLASPSSSYVTGVQLPVDGGYTCM